MEVFDEEGTRVAAVEGKKGALAIENVHLWKPLDAYLYTFRFSSRNGEQGEQLIDEYEEDIGVRTVHVDGNKLYINNEEVYWTGYGEQMDLEIKEEHSAD